MALKLKVHNTLYVGIGDMYRMVIKIANEDDIQLYVMRKNIIPIINVFNMRKKLIIGMVLMSFLLCACQENYTSTDYLENVLDKLNTVESASYNAIGEGWAHGDTAAHAIYHRYVKEYNNPSDSTIGVKFIKLNSDDTTKIEYCYDGNMRALVYHEDKNIVLDSFKVRKLPFRPVPPPFFNYAKSILKYSLETNDSIKLDIEDLNESVYMKLTVIEENQIEFFGKPFRMPISPYNYGEDNSIYEIWINKSDNLPYRIRREMFHDISVTSCENYELNNLNMENFIASDYFPEDYEIKSYGIKKRRKGEHKLLNKNAPDWNLQTPENTSLTLNDSKGKVLLIQFTSVSCGPCKASIPFLQKLSKEYDNEKFDFVSIECSGINANALKSYKQRNRFDYKFLLSTAKVKENYGIQSFPVFFILDENHVIRNVINGYGEGSTDEKIKTSINSLL